MTLEEIEQALTTPSYYSSHHPTSAILRCHRGVNFIEYPREELKQVMREVKVRVKILNAGIDTSTASDRFLLTMLKEFAGDIKD